MSQLQLLVMGGVVVSWKTLQATRSSPEAIRANGRFRICSKVRLYLEAYPITCECCSDVSKMLQLLDRTKAGAALVTSRSRNLQSRPPLRGLSAGLRASHRGYAGARGTGTCRIGR
jgi:hypothetical protein